MKPFQNVVYFLREQILFLERICSDKEYTPFWKGLTVDLCAEGSKMKEFAPLRSIPHFGRLTVDLYEEGSKMKMAELLPLKVYPCTLSGLILVGWKKIAL